MMRRLRRRRRLPVHCQHRSLRRRERLHFGRRVQQRPMLRHADVLRRRQRLHRRFLQSRRTLQ